MASPLNISLKVTGIDQAKADLALFGATGRRSFADIAAEAEKLSSTGSTTNNALRAVATSVRGIASAMDPLTTAGIKLTGQLSQIDRAFKANIISYDLATKLTGQLSRNYQILEMQTAKTAAQGDALTQRMNQLISKFDPATASAKKMAAEIAELNEAQRMGVNIAGGYSAAMENIIASYNGEAEAASKATKEQERFAASLQKVKEFANPALVPLREYKARLIEIQEVAGKLSKSELSAAFAKATAEFRKSVDEVTGVTARLKQAQAEAAKSAADLAKAEELAAASARKHKEAIDPVATILNNYRKALDEVAQLESKTLLSAAEARTRSGQITKDYQKKLDDATGATKRAEKAEKDLAEAAKVAAKEEERLAAVAQKHRDALDPLLPALRTYEKAVKDIHAANAAGHLSDADRTASLARVKKAHDEHTGAMQKATLNSRQMSYVLTNLSFQINDVATGLASGQPMFQVFAQQTGQIYQIIQQGGGLGKVLGEVGKSIAGMISPFTLAAAAIGLVAAGFVLLMSRAAANEAELRKMNVTLTGTTRAALASSEAIQKSMRSLRELGVARDEQAQIMGVVTRTQTINPAAAGDVGLMGANIAALTGTEVIEGVKRLSSAIAGGTEEVIALGLELGRLSQAEIATARDMRKIGGEAAGVDTALASLKRNIKNAREESLSEWEKQVNRIGAAWDNMLDKMSKTGPIASARNALTDMMRKIADLASGQTESGSKVVAPGASVMGETIAGGVAQVGQGLTYATPVGLIRAFADTVVSVFRKDLSDAAQQKAFDAGIGRGTQIPGTFTAKIPTEIKVNYAGSSDMGPDGALARQIRETFQISVHKGMTQGITSALDDSEKALAEWAAAGGKFAAGATAGGVAGAGGAVNNAALSALIAQTESGNNPLAGYGLPQGVGGYPLSSTGFPMRPSVDNSTASGLYQIQRSTWEPIAEKLGITDFSVGSQNRVKDYLLATRGLQPWQTNTKLIQQATEQGLMPAGGINQKILPTQAGVAMPDMKGIDQANKALQDWNVTEAQRLELAKLVGPYQQAQGAYYEKYNEVLKAGLGELRATEEAEKARANSLARNNVELKVAGQLQDELTAGLMRSVKAYAESEEAGIRAVALAEAENEAKRTGGNVADIQRRKLEEQATAAMTAGAKQLAAAMPQIAAQEKIAEAAEHGADAQRDAEQAAAAAAVTQNALAIANAANNETLKQQAKDLNAVALANEKAKARNTANLAINQTINQQKDAVELTRLQASIVGETADEQARLVAQLQAEQKIRNEFKPGDQARIQAFREQTAELSRANKQLAEAQRAQQRWEDSIRSIASTIESELSGAVEKALSGEKAEAWGVRMKRVLNSALSGLTTSLFIKPMLGTIAGGMGAPGVAQSMGSFGSMLGGAGSLFGSQQTITSPTGSTIGTISGGGGMLGTLGSELGITGSSGGIGGFFSGGLGGTFAHTGTVGSITNAAGVTSNLTGTVPGSMFGTTTLGGAFSAVGAGFGAGMLGNSLVGGNQMGGTVGSGVGSLAGMAIGSMVGMPMIGALLGGLGGGMLGGMFGSSKPRNASAGGTIDLASGQITSGFAGGDAQIDQDTRQVVTSVAAVTEALMSVSGKLEGNLLIQGGKNTGFTADSTLPGFEGRFSLGKDPTKAAEMIALALSKSVTGVSDTVRTVLDQTKSLEDIVANLQFAQIYDSVKEAADEAFASVEEATRRAGPFELAMNSIEATFGEITTGATKFGLALEPVNAALAEATRRLQDDFVNAIDMAFNEASGSGFLNQIQATFDQYSADIREAQEIGLTYEAAPQVHHDLGQVFTEQIQNILDTLTESQLDQVIAEFSDLNSIIDELAASTEGVVIMTEELVNAQNLAAQKIAALDAIKEFIEDITTTPSPTVSPEAALAESQRLYGEQLGAAQGGDIEALSGITDIAGSLIDNLNTYYGSSQAGSEAVAAIIEQLRVLAPEQVHAADPAVITNELIEALTDTTTTTQATQTSAITGGIAGLIGDNNATAKELMDQNNASAARLIKQNEDVAAATVANNSANTKVLIDGAMKQTEDLLAQGVLTRDSLIASGNEGTAKLISENNAAAEDIVANAIATTADIIAKGDADTASLITNARLTSAEVVAQAKTAAAANLLVAEESTASLLAQSALESSAQLAANEEATADILAGAKSDTVAINTTARNQTTALLASGTAMNEELLLAGSAQSTREVGVVNAQTNSLLTNANAKTTSLLEAGKADTNRAIAVSNVQTANLLASETAKTDSLLAAGALQATRSVAANNAQTASLLGESKAATTSLIQEGTAQTTKSIAATNTQTARLLASENAKTTDLLAAGTLQTAQAVAATDTQTTKLLAKTTATTNSMLAAGAADTTRTIAESNANAIAMKTASAAQSTAMVAAQNTMTTRTIAVNNAASAKLLADSATQTDKLLARASADAIAIGGTVKVGSDAIVKNATGIGNNALMSTNLISTNIIDSDQLTRTHNITHAAGIKNTITGQFGIWAPAIVNTVAAWGSATVTGAKDNHTSILGQWSFWAGGIINTVAGWSNLEITTAVNNHTASMGQRGFYGNATIDAMNVWGSAQVTTMNNNHNNVVAQWGFWGAGIINTVAGWGNAQVTTATLNHNAIIGQWGFWAPGIINTIAAWGNAEVATATNNHISVLGQWQFWSQQIRDNAAWWSNAQIQNRTGLHQLNNNHRWSMTNWLVESDNLTRTQINASAASGSAHVAGTVAAWSNLLHSDLVGSFGPLAQVTDAWGAANVTATNNAAAGTNYTIAVWSNGIIDIINKTANSALAAANLHGGNINYMVWLMGDMNARNLANWISHQMNNDTALVNSLVETNKTYTNSIVNGIYETANSMISANNTFANNQIHAGNLHNNQRNDYDAGVLYWLDAIYHYNGQIGQVAERQRNTMIEKLTIIANNLRTYDPYSGSPGYYWYGAT